MAKTIGIDLGTTYSCIAHIDENGKPVVLKNAEGDLTTPSVVYFESQNDVTVGSAAKENLKMYPYQTVELIKRNIGKPGFSLNINGIDMKPEEILVLKNAQERGLCAGKLSEIEVFGDDFENIVVHDFKRARSSSIDFTTRVPKFMQPLAKRILTPYPKINTAQCVGCGKCAESCPQHTITVREHKAHIEYSKCIHCFCCHEMCPKHVINIKRFSLFDL